MGDLVRGTLAGLVGGLFAGMAMDGFQADIRSVTGGSGGGGDGEQDSEEPVTVTVARKISRGALGRDLEEDKAKQAAGNAVHYLYSTLWGGVYGGLAEVQPALAVGMGLPFGIALWLFGDELGLPAMGLAKWPTEYPASTHVYSLSSHLVYGLVTDLVRRGLRGTEES